LPLNTTPFSPRDCGTPGEAENSKYRSYRIYRTYYRTYMTYMTYKTAFNTISFLIEESFRKLPGITRITP